MHTALRHNCNSKAAFQKLTTTVELHTSSTQVRCLAIIMTILVSIMIIIAALGG